MSHPHRVAPGVPAPAAELHRVNSKKRGLGRAFGTWADLGFAKLTVIPAFRATNLNYITFPTFVNSTSPETSRETTLELRLKHTDDRVKWVAGAFFMSEMQAAHNDVVVGLLQNQHSDENLRTVSGSIFSEATVSINETLRLITDYAIRMTRNPFTEASS